MPNFGRSAQKQNTATQSATRAIPVLIPVGWKPSLWKTRSLTISNGTIRAHSAKDMMSARKAILGYTQ